MNSQMSGHGGFGGGRQYSADDLRRLSRNNSQAMMNNMMTDASMTDASMLDGQNFEDVMNQNLSAAQRSGTYHPQMDTTGGGGLDNSRRRVSMMEFGSLQNKDLDGFQFSPSSMVHSSTNLPNGGGIARRRMEARQAAQRRESAGSLAADSQYQGMTPNMNDMAHSPLFPESMGAEPMNLDAGNDFVGMNMTMDIGNGMNPSMFDNMPGMGMYSSADFGIPVSSMQQDPSPSMLDLPQNNAPQLSNAAEQAIMEKLPQMKMSDAQNSNFAQSMQLAVAQAAGARASQNGMSQSALSSSGNVPGTSYSSLSQEQMSSNVSSNSISANHNNFSTGAPVTNSKGQQNMPQYLNAYSSTGFDMLGVLMRVATRPHPQINIGAVDMSCAFVVCDVTQHDVPIVYCSEMFERLTGYSRHEILGRNCRFLQAPDGKVQAGLKRRYVDDSAVLHLKNMINLRSEAQISLINYRKGGQPFMNLLTMIPIAWDTDDIKFIVGFQVDLVEQPTSITNKNPGKYPVVGGSQLLRVLDGSYSINYQRGFLPTFVFNSTPETNRGKEVEVNQPIERDEVSMVLGSLGTNESELYKRIWDKVLLEGSDDVLHVLSLKGLFLYLSQASKKVLEYDPHELVGTALSSVCHPSDIVPVTRELKDTTPGSTVNVVFRIRRKHSGYTWFESHGSLHTEQGKGKKCIILVGRERPVYALRRSELVNPDAIGENELWTKLSTSGMFLYVSSHARSLLDRQPDELRGTSAQSLMRPESKAEFNKILELARIGLTRSLSHDIQNRRGQTLHASTTLYPGDATEGQKPTFLVAQTKLLKMSRGPASLSKQNSGASGTSDKSSFMPTGSESQGATPMQQSTTPMQSGNGVTQTAEGATPQGAGQGGGGASGGGQSLTPGSTQSHPPAEGIVTAAGAHALPIGSQHQIIASEDNVFDELKTTRSTSWQFELRQMEKRNRVLAEEMQSLMSNKKKRKRRKGLGQLQKDCVNCHTRSTPEWRRGPSGNRDLCNSCGLRWAKQVRLLLLSFLPFPTIPPSLFIPFLLVFFFRLTANTFCFSNAKQNGRGSPRTTSSHHSDLGASVSPAGSGSAKAGNANASANANANANANATSKPNTSNNNNSAERNTKSPPSRKTKSPEIQQQQQQRHQFADASAGKAIKLEPGGGGGGPAFGGGGGTGGGSRVEVIDEVAEPPD